MGSMNQMTPEVAQLLHLPMGQMNNMQQMQMQQQMQQMMAMQGMDQAMFMQMQQMQNMQNQHQHGQNQGGQAEHGQGQSQGQEQEEGSIPQDSENAVSVPFETVADLQRLLLRREEPLLREELQPCAVAFPQAPALLREVPRTDSGTRTVLRIRPRDRWITVQREAQVLTAVSPADPGHARPSKGTSVVTGAGARKRNETGRETGTGKGTERGKEIESAIESATATAGHRDGTGTDTSTTRRASIRAMTMNGPRGGSAAGV